MPQDHPAEFRERVLRRVAEKDDLDAVAREFGLPADLVFGWLKGGAESGRVLGTRSPPRPGCRGVAAGARRIRGSLLVLSIMSAGMFAIALPAIPHRFASRPVDVRTTIVAKTISGGKSTSYCFGTVAAPPVIDSVRACTDADTFRRARLAETIVLHGTASWVGFAVTRSELEPKVD